MSHEDDLVWVDDEDEEMQTAATTFGFNDVRMRVLKDPSGGKVLRIYIGDPRSTSVALQITEAEWVRMVQGVRRAHGIG